MKEKQGNPNKPKGKKRIRLSRTAMAAVRHLRSLPPDEARFTLTVSQEGTPHSMSVIRNGFGCDSAYYVHQAPSGSVPEWLPPASTYVVKTDADMDTVLCMFADSPALWSGPASDALDLPHSDYREGAEEQ